MNIVLCTNNKLEDPFLHSQLLNIYADCNSSGDKVYLFSRVNKKIDLNGIHIINIEYGIFSFFMYIIKLIKLSWLLKKEKTVYHIRGVVSGVLFYFVRNIIYFIKKNPYIYDPRGLFIMESIESNRWKSDGIMVKILTIIEKSLIKNSLKTIVTANGFKKSIEKTYGFNEKLEVLYNVSSFKNQNYLKSFKNKEIVNLCYVGSINYWHDLNEIIRLISYINQIIPQKCKLFFLTNYKNYNEIENKLKINNINDYTIEFIPYIKLESILTKMDICISVVKPTKTSILGSPIKVSDYVMLDKLMILNSGIGDFDEFYKTHQSAILYQYGKNLTFSYLDLLKVDIMKNESLKKYFSIEQNRNIILSWIKGI